MPADFNGNADAPGLGNLNLPGGGSPGSGESERLAVRLLGRPIQRIRTISTGFSGAIVLRVEAPPDDYCIRGWPINGPPRERLFELRRLLAHWRNHGLPVAVPIELGGADNAFLWWSDRWWQAEPWLPGTAASPGTISDQRLGALMLTLADLHRTASGFVCNPEFRDLFGTGLGPPPAVRFRRSLIASWTPQRIAAVRETLAKSPDEFGSVAPVLLDGFVRCAPRIDRELAGCERFPVPVHPCWRDLWSEHVLFTDDRVTGLIDPGSARMDHVSGDLSRILGSLLRDDAVAWNRAIEQYEASRPLTLEERRLIPVMDRSSVLLSGMTWVERWERREIDPARLPAILDRLRSISQRLWHLASHLD